MNTSIRPLVAAMFLLTSSNLAFAGMPGMPAGLPAPPPMPKIGCGVAAPPYMVALPGSGVILSMTVTLHNTQAQLFRASLCTVAAQRDLLDALGSKDLAAKWGAAVTNLAGTSINPENQAAVLALAGDPELNKALAAAAESVTAATDEQKVAIQAADVKRAVAVLALATLAVDAGRLIIDIAGVVKKVADGDASVLEEVTKAQLTLQVIQLWPEQVKQIAASANAFGKAAKETDKALKAVYKKAKIDPPKAADVKKALLSGGDE